MLRTPFLQSVSYYSAMSVIEIHIECLILVRKFTFLYCDEMAAIYIVQGISYVIFSR
jgi:hypothetical protein